MTEEIVDGIVWVGVLAIAILYKDIACVMYIYVYLLTFNLWSVGYGEETGCGDYIWRQAAILIPVLFTMHVDHDYLFNRLLGSEAFKTTPIHG